MRALMAPVADVPLAAGKNAAAVKKAVSMTTGITRWKDDPWDVFELDEDTIETEPQDGDFWGEIEDEELEA